MSSLTNLELRSKTREFIAHMITSGSLPSFTTASGVTKKKKLDGTAEELLLHQRALKMEADSSSTSYRQAYQSLLLELHSLIVHQVPNVWDCFVRGLLGWNSPLFHEHEEKERIDIKNIIQPMEVTDGMYTCPKCKSNKTFFYSRQTRSADEPMTTFITCANNDCQYRWKIN